MSHAVFHLYGDLDYFLPAEQQASDVAYALDEKTDGKVTVKHALEDLGIPHTEVDQLKANGNVINFDYALRAGDTIEVWAWLPKPDHINLRPPLPRPVRFVVDTHLGRLAVYLRLLGFDTLYRNDYSDTILAETSQQEQRVLLTRDRGLLKRRIVDFGCCVRQSDPKQQLTALIRRYNLLTEVRPWQRCLRCNHLLTPVAKADVLDRLEPKTERYFEEFRQCQGCRQVYWRGSHYDRMQAFIDQVLAESSP